MTPRGLPSAMSWQVLALEDALQSTCERGQCGAVIVRDGELVSRGFNGPALGSSPSCALAAPSLLKPKSDRTCCVHAEWRALLAAQAQKQAIGATLHFQRAEVGLPAVSGRPYCTVCSRLALEVGLASWVLHHDGELRQYDALEYHELSERYDALMAQGPGPSGGRTVRPCIHCGAEAWHYLRPERTWHCERCGRDDLGR